MKTKSKQFFKSLLALSTLTLAVSFLFSLSFPLDASAYSKKRNFCKKVPRAYGRKLSKSFKQSPFYFLEQFLGASNSNNSDLNRQNQLISASFDIKKITRANARVFKSKVITNNLFDWVRTQYFGNLRNNYTNRTQTLVQKHYDLLTESERLNMINFKPQWTSIKRLKCSRREAALLGCKNGMLKMTLQFLPEVSCKDSDFKKAFETEFFLTYSSNFGFKILDIKLSGKRLVLDSIDMMLSLKKEGFNKNAIAKHLNVLSLGQRKFKSPKRQVHSGRFLAKFKSRAQDERVPASL